MRVVFVPGFMQRGQAWSAVAGLLPERYEAVPLAERLVTVAYPIGDALVLAAAAYLLLTGRNGRRSTYLLVASLCALLALIYGITRGDWLRGFLAGSRRPPRAPEPFTPEALPDDPRDAVAAGLELFNESYHPRTVCGIARTLGDPQVSVVMRSHREVVVTVAWDLSWYQFRVDMLGSQPVTLQHRGEDVGEIDSRFRDWNAQAEPDGTLALAV